MYRSNMEWGLPITSAYNPRMATEPRSFYLESNALSIWLHDPIRVIFPHSSESFVVVHAQSKEKFLSRFVRVHAFTDTMNRISAVYPNHGGRGRGGGGGEGEEHMQQFCRLMKINFNLCNSYSNVYVLWGKQDTVPQFKSHGAMDPRVTEIMWQPRERSVKTGTQKLDLFISRDLTELHAQLINCHTRIGLFVWPLYAQFRR